MIEIRSSKKSIISYMEMVFGTNKKSYCWISSFKNIYLKILNLIEV